MVHPSNPNRICFEMNIPELLCQETFVASSNIKEIEASFSPRHTNIFPGDQDRVTLSDVTYKKFQQMLMICLITLFGIGKMFSQNYTISYNIDRTISNLPANVRCLPIQLWTDDSSLCKSREY